MARRTATYTVTTEGRDKGSVFLLTEMPADQAEEWGLRALCALAKAGVEIPEDYKSMTMAAMATMGIQSLAGIPFGEAKPLLDEMMECVQIIPDPARPDVLRALFPGDIEEVITRLTLRREVFQLHVGFSLAATLSKPKGGKRAAVGA